MMNVSNNTNDQVLEQRQRINLKLSKVKELTPSPARNSAIILLQQAHGYVMSGDLQKGKQLYAKADDCLKYNMSYL